MSCAITVICTPKQGRLHLSAACRLLQDIGHEIHRLPSAMSTASALPARWGTGSPKQDLAVAAQPILLLSWHPLRLSWQGGLPAPCELGGLRESRGILKSVSSWLVLRGLDTLPIIRSPCRPACASTQQPRRSCRTEPHHVTTPPHMYMHLWLCAVQRGAAMSPPGSRLRCPGPSAAPRPAP
jgi:hypothetical protein